VDWLEACITEWSSRIKSVGSSSLDGERCVNVAWVVNGQLELRAKRRFLRADPPFRGNLTSSFAMSSSTPKRKVIIVPGNGCTNVRRSNWFVVVFHTSECAIYSNIGTK
jgi:hypothetical protein